MARDIYDEMADRWPSAIVARREIGKFTGGLLRPQTMANLNSRGEGPRQITLRARQVFYPVRDLVSWLRDRSREG